MSISYKNHKRSIGESYYRPKDSSLTFLWPMGITYLQRKKILDKAYLAYPNRNGGDIIRWLRKNAWKFIR